jgi:hypothetical protein
MATATKYLEYTIFLKDKAVVTAQQAAHPDGLHIAPDAAALTFLAPIQYTTDPVVVPGIRSPWLILGSEYPRNVATFTRKVGGWFGIGFLFGTNTTYHWVGKFVYASGTAAEIDGAPQEIVAMAQRKWVMGFEAQADGELLSMGTGVPFTRDASRHADGLGFPYRDVNTNMQAFAANGGAPLGPATWERFYIRIRTAPTVSQQIWQTGNGTTGAVIDVTPDGHLLVQNMVVGVKTLYAAPGKVLTVGQWYRIDILLRYQNAGLLKLYVGRQLLADVTMAAGAGGLSQVANHVVSLLGTGTSDDTFEADFDDWIGAEWPTADSHGKYVGIDWLNGSKVQRVGARQLGATNNFTGDYRYLNQESPATAPTNASMTSTTSGDGLIYDAEDKKIDNTPGSLGIAAFVACWFYQQAASIAGTPALFGWRHNGLLDLAAIALTVNNSEWVRRVYRPTGLTVPQDVTPLEIHHIKYGNVSAARCWGSCVSAELIGTFGSEDVPEDTAESDFPTALPPKRGVHMSAYPESAWVRATLPPVSPVIIHSGTYVGNGTVIELQFRTPVTWLLIKREAAASAGGVWWSTAVTNGHSQGTIGPNSAVLARIDPSFTPSGVVDTQEQRSIVRITGDNAVANNTGDTYNYIAFCDPGARFSLNGQFFHRLGIANYINALFNAGFNADGIFFQKERIATVDGSFAKYYKGPGHAAPNGSILNGAEAATIAAEGAGSITSGVTLHNDAFWIAFEAFRQDDQSSDPNKHKVLKVGSYTGDGSASRTVSWAPPTGLRPLFAIVVPHNAASLFRTPSNTGTISNNLSGTQNAATGITGGGIDQFSVGSALNTNAVVYDWLVFLGSATAGNGGWSIDGEFAYIEPDAPDGFAAVDPDEPDPATPEDPDPDPGPSDEDDCDAGEVCVASTTRVVNEALLEIGSTKVLTNYCTQGTIEAQVARILYEPSVRATLHAFPWPFATKYAVLALAATQPTDQDWAFSYRQPIDCIFERRIVVDRGPGVDPKGPPFELSSDASGGLIFTNEPNAVLEYTMRPSCVAFTGDALFREALKWHLSAAMAPPVTRMADKAKFCREQFDLCIDKANAIVRPDDPGLRDAPAWQAADAGAGCMTANISVVNLALMRIGCNTIANLTTEQSREATSANLIFEHELRATLRDYPWKFAKRYDQALVLLGGTDTVPINPDWQYSYRLPADYVMARRLVTDGTGRSFERYPKTFEVSTDATGPVLFTGEVDPNLEYTARIGCVVSRADDLFRDALAWRIAASLAPSLAQVDPERPEQPGRTPEHPPENSQRVSHRPSKAAARAQAARYAFARYLAVLGQARAQDANEAQPEKDGDAEWIEGRN